MEFIGGTFLSSGCFSACRRMMKVKLSEKSENERRNAYSNNSSPPSILREINPRVRRWEDPFSLLSSFFTSYLIPIWVRYAFIRLARISIFHSLHSRYSLCMSRHNHLINEWKPTRNAQIFLILLVKLFPQVLYCFLLFNDNVCVKLLYLCLSQINIKCKLLSKRGKLTEAIYVTEQFVDIVDEHVVSWVNCTQKKLLVAANVSN